MPASQQNIQKVINILQDVDTAMKELLKDSSELYLHSSTILKRLCNGFAHASGIQMDESAPVQEKRVPLTHIAGIPIQARPEPLQPADATPTAGEQDQLQELVDSALAEFPYMESSAILESFSELIIRGAAVKMRLPVTPTEPAIIDIALIDTIKAACSAPEPEVKETVKPPKAKKS